MANQAGSKKKAYKLLLPGPWILNQKPYSLARITMFPKEIVLVEVELSSYTEKLLTGGRTDGQTDRHGA